MISTHHTPVFFFLFFFTHSCKYLINQSCDSSIRHKIMQLKLKSFKRQTSYLQWPSPQMSISETSKSSGVLTAQQHYPERTGRCDRSFWRWQFLVDERIKEWSDEIKLIGTLQDLKHRSLQPWWAKRHLRTQKLPMCSKFQPLAEILFLSYWRNKVKCTWSFPKGCEAVADVRPGIQQTLINA